MADGLLILAFTPLSYAIGWLIGIPVLLPFLNALLPWYLMARRLVRSDATGAIALMLLWALTMAIVATLMAASGISKTRDGGDLFLRSSYRDEMLRWVRTGEGAESRPAEFLPVHAGHAVVFTIAAVTTGGALAMPMGATLVNQMSEYVGALAAGAAHPLAVAVLAWHPLAVLRVIAFVIIGVLLSGILISRVCRSPYSVRAHSGWLWTAGAMLLGDVSLKTILAPSWAVLLRGLAGW
jgi:hypothetical protein